jgi:Protein of unknown function DUF45
MLVSLERTVPVEVFEAEVRKWAERIGVEANEIYARDMTRKWASCSSRGRNLRNAMDWGLAAGPCLLTHPRFDAVRMSAYRSRAMLLANVTYRFPMGRHLGLIGSRGR